MKKNSIKNTFHPISNIEAVKKYEEKYNMQLDDLMMMFLLKIELKRICKRKNSKTAFVHNNPNNTYIKQSKRKRIEQAMETDEKGFDTFDSINETSLDQKKETTYTLGSDSEKQIIIKDSGKEIIMQETKVRSRPVSKKSLSHDHIISKHERGEELTKDEMARMEMVHHDLTQPMDDIEEVKGNEMVMITKDDDKIVMQTESEDKYEENDVKDMKRQIEKQRNALIKVTKSKKKAEEKLLEMQNELEENLEEMDAMQQAHEREMNKMHEAIETLKDQQNRLQGEIEKKNEFISLERNDKEGYSGLLEKLQAELNALKREKDDDKKSFVEKSKELEETENNLGKKIKELAESRSQIYDLKNQIAHLKAKNQKLMLGVSTGEDSKLFAEAAQMESEKDILKFTQDEYDDHMKRIENIMTANETEKLLLQKEIERLGGEIESLERNNRLLKESQEGKKERDDKSHEEDTLRLQRKQRELEVMKDQNKKLFEDNKTLSNKYNQLKKFRKEIKSSSDQMFLQMNRNRELSDKASINFDFTETGNPLGNIVLATQIFKNDNHRKKKEKGDPLQMDIFKDQEEQDREKKIRASPPIRSRVSQPPKDHFTNRNHPHDDANQDEQIIQIGFNKKAAPAEQEVNSSNPGNHQRSQKKPMQFIQIQQNEVLEVQDYNRNEYLNRSKSPRVLPYFNLIE
jgi:chromosome segregation ATPase